LIELADDQSSISMTTIFEDKCTDNPRKSFLEKVLKTFCDRHKNKRSAELVAAASALLRMAGIDEANSARLAEAVLNRDRRSYRAAFALTREYDSQIERTKLFEGYDALDGLSPERRIGAGLIVDGELRGWFDALALQAVAYLDEFETEAA
jgi:hypothetical protein